jgi:ferritin-like metal-binding protein YciE
LSVLFFALGGLKPFGETERNLRTPTIKNLRRRQDLNEELTAAFEKHHEETQAQIERLEEVFAMIEKKPQGKTCAAIVIVEEGAEIMQEYKGSSALDAGLLAAAQAVEHYEISRYGTLSTWAEELGLEDAVPLLQETLEEEKATLGESAKTAVNQQAKAS